MSTYEELDVCGVGSRNSYIEPIYMKKGKFSFEVRGTFDGWLYSDMESVTSTNERNN